MTRHERILKATEENAIACLSYCLPRPSEIDVSGDVICCFNGIYPHDDSHLDAVWSAFYVIHNDGCRVWGRGVGFVPKEGDTFAMNIHKRHGVTARRKTNQVFLAVFADGESEKVATTKLRQILRELAA